VPDSSPRARSPRSTGWRGLDASSARPRASSRIAQCGDRVLHRARPSGVTVAGPRSRSGWPALPRRRSRARHHTVAGQVHCVEVRVGLGRGHLCEPRGNRGRRSPLGPTGGRRASSRTDRTPSARRRSRLHRRDSEEHGTEEHARTFRMGRAWGPPSGAVSPPSLAARPSCQTRGRDPWPVRARAVRARRPLRDVGTALSWVSSGSDTPS